MKKLLFLICLTPLFYANSTIHIVRVWSGYYQFLPDNIAPIVLGDTIQWLPLDEPMMAHTITSTTIPNGATSFDYLWQAPADTFFQYIPTQPGIYNYECTPHVSFNMISSFEVIGNGVSINELFSKNNTIFPNPTLTSINVPFYYKKEFEIMDANGKLIRKGNNSGYINTQEFNKGIYYLKIEDERILFIKED